MTGQMIRFGTDAKYAGYFSAASDGSPAVVVLHAWWGLSDFFKELCDRLAEAGFTALAPDLFDGRVTVDIEEAGRQVEQADPEFVQEAAAEAVDNLVRTSGQDRIGVIGFSFGAAWATVTSLVRPQNVAAVVLFYGAYNPDMSQATAAFLGHFADEDAWEPHENVDALRSALEAANRPFAFFTYPGVGHWFFEPDRPDAYDAAAAALAWERTVSFMRQELGAV